MPLDYLISLPERLVRSATALAAGLVQELSDVAIPAPLRRTRLYEALVGLTLRFLIEQVGEVKDAYPAGEKLAEDFLLRRAAGNGLELAGIIAFRASPVWVLAALADISGAGRTLIREITDSLKQDGLLDARTSFETVDEMLDGLERSAGQATQAINMPPLHVAGLREEWVDIARHLKSIPSPNLPSIGTLESQWRALKQQAAAQRQSVFRLSSLMALSAFRNLPQGMEWFSKTAVRATAKTGEWIAAPILQHYTESLADIRRTGFVAYWAREYRPYLKGAIEQFSPSRPTLTARLLRRKRR